MRKIELLSPAGNYAIGIAAINCGADAVYIGAPRYGARKEESNTVSDIQRLADYAHRFNARVYATMNTLLSDTEMDDALLLARQLYDAGVDAFIIQDYGLLEAGLPPLPIIASTQMHNDSPEKIRFLESVGFSRVILPRELSLHQIRDIRKQTSVELEVFVYGSLCVAYSGQCYLSVATTGRSGNRGECSQPCRMRYSLKDSKGQFLIKNKYLLSLKDLNLSASLRELMEAGVHSFK